MKKISFLLWLYFVIVFEFINFSHCVKIIDRRENTPGKRYRPEWESLDTRPIPEWYDRAKIGIFIHWGVYSVPAHGTEWFWFNWRTTKDKSYVKYMEKNFEPNFTYQKFASEFNAQLYDPLEWATLFAASGAKYVVFTSKHHDGYAMWPTKYSFGWNALDVGPKRDLLGDLASAIRNTTDLKFGVYHSLYEWYNPLYVKDRQNNFEEDDYVTNKVIPQLQELIHSYQPDIVWSDGDWEAPDTYWNSTDFLAWLYNSSPVKDTVVVNDRWGKDIPCNHGDFFTCQDRYNPGTLQKHKWENAMTIDEKSWGYRPEANVVDYLQITELIKQIVTTVSCGGNILMNVGPTKDGKISPIYQERLLQIGVWLGINGEAIYDTVPWKIQNDTVTSNVWYTFRYDTQILYIIFLTWPRNTDYLYVKYDGEAFGDKTEVFLVNKKEEIKLEWTIMMEDDNGKVEITLPNFRVAQSKWAWVLKVRNPKLLRREH